MATIVKDLSTIDEYFERLDDLIRQANALNKNKNTLATLKDRVDLFILCMTIVQKAENDFQEFKVYGKATTERLITLDYKISDYARRLYGGGQNVITAFTAYKDRLREASVTDIKRTQFTTLLSTMLAISARWDIESFIRFSELDKEEADKAYPARRPLLKDVIFYANRMNASKLGIHFKDGIEPKRIIFAVQPNAGKSFVVNVYSVLATILHALYYKTSGILRMSNNGSNACGFSSQIKGMIENESITLVYPELKKYFVDHKPKILEKSTLEEWKLADLDPRIRASFFARGRDSAINSLRVFVALEIDDLSDGFDQMNNDEAHQAMTTKYYIDMISRKDKPNIPEFIVGTMFNEFDIPNTLIKELEATGSLIDDPKNANVRYTKDYGTVVIQVDCFDEKGESVAPMLKSTADLKSIQAKLKTYEFDLVYRQIRASREPRPFDWQNLQLYATKEKKLSETAKAVVDPTRKNGNDYFSMPIFKFNETTQRWRLIDIIYEQKSLGKLSDPENAFLLKVCKKLISNNVTNFTIENNTSNTLGAFIEQKLESLGYKSCKIEEIYTAKQRGQEGKVERIMSQEATITRNIEFPAPQIIKPQTDLAKFMEDLTRFDAKETSSRKRHDDAPDSLAMFSKKYLFNAKNRYTEIKAISKNSLFS